MLHDLDDLSVIVAGGPNPGEITRVEVTALARDRDGEARLGTRLLLRTSRRLALSDASRGYVAACRRILEQVDKAERVAAGEYVAPRGELTVSAPVVFGRRHLLPVIVAFLAAYADIDNSRRPTIGFAPRCTERRAA